MKNLFPILLILSAAGISLFLLKDQFLGSSSTHEVSAVGDPSASAGSKEKFDYLAAQTGNTCGLQLSTVSNYSDDRRVQGSCCSKMDFHGYQEQVEGLKKFKDLPFIPSDPYDISGAQAKQLFSFLENIELNPAQQAIYNEAAKISDEGGPCCCKCWHWDAYEGLAKKLIVDYDWGAQQIAELWDLSNACGGTHDG